MKLSPHKLTVFLLILVVETQCGVIDNLFGKVRNTTSALRQDVRNVLTYSKNVVGLETATEDNRPEEEKRGLIGGMLHATREKVHNIRNYFWNNDANASDAGIFGNMFNRVKNRLSRVKGSILGENPTPSQPLSDSEKLVQKTLDKLFFGNGTRHVHGRAFQEAIDSLKRKLHEIRTNMTGTTESPINHGEGIIDIRAGLDIEKNINDNTPGVDNDVFDAVDDSLKKAKDETAKSYNNIKDDADKAASTLRNGVDNAVSGLNAVRDKASDAITKENELLKDSYDKINAETKNIENKVKNAAEDAKRLSY